MRVFYGIILIIIILQQLSWGFPSDKEYTLTDYYTYYNQHQQNAHGTIDGDYEDRAGNSRDNNTAANDKDNRRNPENLRGLG